MQTNEQPRIVDMTRSGAQTQPTDLNTVKTFATIVMVAAVACLLVLVAFLGVVVAFFGEEGARILLVVVAMMGVFWFVSRNQAQVRRENLQDLTRVQEVAVQSIIQHQRADDQGEVARMIPAVLKALVGNQHKGQQLATEIARHGRWLADSEAKVARSQKPAFPFEMVGADAEEEMEELI
jgi:hypothetical protein